MTKPPFPSPRSHPRLHPTLTFYQSLMLHLLFLLACLVFQVPLLLQMLSHTTHTTPLPLLAFSPRLLPAVWTGCCSTTRRPRGAACPPMPPTPTSLGLAWPARPTCLRVVWRPPATSPTRLGLVHHCTCLRLSLVWHPPARLGLVRPMCLCPSMM